MTFKPGRSLRAAFGEFASAQFGHHHVGHQQIDRPRMAFAQRQTFASVARLDHHVPARLQNSSRQHADRLFVLHQQNDSRSPWAPWPVPAGRAHTRSDRLGNRRQEDPEARSLAQLRPAPDDAAALLHDAQNRGQTQAGSLPGLLRREERLEDMRPASPRPCPRRCRAPPASRSGPAEASCSRASASVRVRLAVSMVSVPPSGMASRAFSERFMIARPISPGSALTCQRSGCAIDRHLDPLAHQCGAASARNPPRWHSGRSPWVAAPGAG